MNQTVRTAPVWPLGRQLLAECGGEGSPGHGTSNSDDPDRGIATLLGWVGFLTLLEIHFDRYFAKCELVSQDAQQVTPVRWWKRFWLWLTALFAGKGCLKWLLRALLFLLLLLFFYGC